MEDIDHFVMKCEYLVEERSRKERLMIDRVDGWNELGDSEKVVIVMDKVCKEAVARAIEKMWNKQFVSFLPSPTRHDLCWLL